MRFKSRGALLTSLSVAMLMVGCGLASTPGKIVPTSSVTFDSLSSKGLRDGFKALHLHVFGLIDTNRDQRIDEAEASRYFDLTTEFPVLSRSVGAQRGNGLISRTEFLLHASRGSFLGSLVSPQIFAQKTRAYLNSFYARLDQPIAAGSPAGDDSLSYDELAAPLVADLGMSFGYPKFGLEVAVSAFDPADVSAADLGRDGKLSRAEFEDLYMLTVLRQMRAKYPLPGAPLVAPSPLPQPTANPVPVPSAIPSVDPCPICPPPEY